MASRITTFAAVALLIAPVSFAAQQTKSAPDTMVMATPAATLAWGPLQPPGFDPGMEVAVIKGDPSVADQPYVIRLRFPDGYRFPAHWHPVDESLTVLEGEFLLAMGEKADESKLQHRYLPGDFIFAPRRNPHFGGAVGQTVIQLHGVGPFAIIVVGSPEDKR